MPLNASIVVNQHPDFAATGGKVVYRFKLSEN
jgi:hypothetical protein